MKNVLISKFNGEEISVTAERRIDELYPYYERVECVCGGAVWFDVSDKYFNKFSKCINCGNKVAIRLVPISINIG